MKFMVRRGLRRAPVEPGTRHAPALCLGNLLAALPSSGAGSGSRFCWRWIGQPTTAPDLPSVSASLLGAGQPETCSGGARQLRRLRMSEKADDVQKADQAAWRTWHKKPMIVVGLLWFAAVLCGSGIWAGAGISCSSDEAKASFERKDASCRKFNRKYPTVSMLMLHRPAKNAMRGFVIPGILVNGAADLGLAAKLGDRYRGDGAKCANMSAALFAVMSLIAILIGMGTNPRGMTHVTACVTWAFFRMIWGWLLLCVVCTSCNCGPIQLAYTVVRVVYGGVLTFLGLKLATQAHSGNMPGHLEMMVVIGVLIFQVSLTPEAAGLWEPEAAGGPDDASEAAPDGVEVAA